jgi:hypothetical protein
MGGYVALYLASANENLLDKIAKLGTKFDWNSEIAIKESKILNAEQIEIKVPKFTEALAARHGENNGKELLSRTAKMKIDLGNNNLLNDSLLKSIENKKMLGLADNDNMVSFEEINIFLSSKRKNIFYVDQYQTSY